MDARLCNLLVVGFNFYESEAICRGSKLLNVASNIK